MVINNMRKKSKKQKLLNYKKAVRHARAVVNASKRGELPHSVGAEQFLREIEPHLTKKGNLKKRDIRSNVQIANINKIISQYVTKNDINKSVKKLIKEYNYRAKNLEKKRVAINNKGKSMVNNFINFSNFELQGIFYMTSDQIVALTNEYGDISVDDIDFIINELVQNKINKTPNELLEYIKQDDFYKLSDKILDLIHNKAFNKEDIFNVFINTNNKDYAYSDKEMKIFNYLADNTIFSL